MDKEFILSLLLGCVLLCTVLPGIGWYVRRQRKRFEDEFRQSSEFARLDRITTRALQRIEQVDAAELLIPGYTRRLIDELAAEDMAAEQARTQAQVAPYQEFYGRAKDSPRRRINLTE